MPISLKIFSSVKSNFMLLLPNDRFSKVSQLSRQSLKSYNSKFVMDKCARNNYGVTLKFRFFYAGFYCIPFS